MLFRSELIEVEYEALPAVPEVEQAAADGAPRLWDACPTGNTAFMLMFCNAEATEQAFTGAKHVVSLRLENNRLCGNAIEPRVALGSYEAADEAYTLYSTTQNPHGVRSALAGHVFHVAETKMRVISPDVGGGFGPKGGPYPEDALVLWASRRIGRPVKWLQTRGECLLGDNHARDQVIRGELALDADEIGRAHV